MESQVSGLLRFLVKPEESLAAIDWLQKLVGSKESCVEDWTMAPTTLQDVFYVLNRDIYEAVALDMPVP